MVQKDPKKFFEAILTADPSITFDVTEELIQTGVMLGNNLPLFRGIYLTHRNAQEQFEHKPMIGAPLTVTFDYEKKQVLFDRKTSQFSLSEDQFLQFLGKVDAAFLPIYPIGTTVELDEQLLPENLSEMFTNGGLGARVTLTGRKVPLMEGFENYVVDYLGRLWPFGELPNGEPILISNMMIKRVLETGYSDDYEETFSFDVLRATQANNCQQSSAYMSPSVTKQYIERLTEIVNQEGE